LFHLQVAVLFFAFEVFSVSARNVAYINQLEERRPVHKPVIIGCRTSPMPNVIPENPLIHVSMGPAVLRLRIYLVHRELNSISIASERAIES
jgi:hypothetical protein